MVGRMSIWIAAFTVAACGGGSIPNVDTSCPSGQIGCETAIDTNPGATPAAPAIPATPAKATVVEEGPPAS